MRGLWKTLWKGGAKVEKESIFDRFMRLLRGKHDRDSVTVIDRRSEVITIEIPYPEE